MLQPLLDNVLIEDVPAPEKAPGTSIVIPEAFRNKQTHGTVKRGIVQAVGPGKFPENPEVSSPFVSRLPVSSMLKPGVRVLFKGYGVECPEDGKKLRVIAEADILAVEQ